VPAAAAGSGPAGARTYVVQPGDTLWAIARRLQPTGDLRPLVARLSRANGGTVVVPGQRVVLP
jgi:LysM repeat protein